MELKTMTKMKEKGCDHPNVLEGTINSCNKNEK